MNKLRRIWVLWPLFSYPAAFSPFPIFLRPFIGYTLVSLAATWPLIMHLRGWVPGLGDWGQNLWALWWTRRSLLVLAQHPFFTNYLFYPEGVTLLFHPLDVSDGLLALPVYGAFGGDIAYNLIILLSFILGGWGAYLLALYLTGQRGPSFVAGLVFVLSPYHFLRIDLGHLNLSTLQWLPFYALFLLKFVQEGSRRSAALAVFFWVFTALHSWYYVVYCGLLSIAILFWPGRRVNESGPWPPVRPHSSAPVRFFTRLRRVSSVLAAALLLLIPLLAPMFWLLNSTTLVGAHNPVRHSVDGLSFWVAGPPSTWATWFEPVWIAYAAQNREPGASAYLGYSVLSLSLVGLISRRRRRQTGWWFVVGLGFTLLALGPRLQIAGQIFEIPLPYQFLAELIPAFSLTGIPGRFVVMTSLALAMLTAYGLATLIRVSQRLAESVKSQAPFTMLPRLRPDLLCWLAGALIGLEYLAAPLRLSPTEAADFYRVMAADSESYAVLDIKWDANFLMHAQTVHGKPLIGGWLARLPAGQAAYLDQGSLDRVFLYLLLGPEGARLTEPDLIQPAVQNALLERNVRYIIDHDNTTAGWLEQFVGWPVVYQAGEIVVYGKNP